MKRAKMSWRQLTFGRIIDVRMFPAHLHLDFMKISFLFSGM